MDRTEYIINEHNPKFEETFIVNYYFKKDNKIKLALYDVEDKEEPDELNY